MAKTYGDDWDKRCLAFLKRFEDENYLIKVPKVTETLDPYPTPRTWTALAALMAKGINDKETIRGLVGYEVGTKFDAFLKVRVDINELINNPEVFHELEFDAKYMVSVMLASWISQHIKNAAKAFPLIDEMSKEKRERLICYILAREFLVLTCMSISRKNLVQFLRQLFTYNPMYKDVLSEIAIGLKEQITV